MCKYVTMFLGSLLVASLGIVSWQYSKIQTLTAELTLCRANVATLEIAIDRQNEAIKRNEAKTKEYKQNLAKNNVTIDKEYSLSDSLRVMDCEARIVAYDNLLKKAMR